MKLSFVKPKQELSPYVEAIWVFESPMGLPIAENSMAAPNGCPKLTFAYGSSFTSVANGRATVRPEETLSFVGNRDSSILLQSGPRKIGCIGVEFRPHGAFPVFGTSMREALNFLGEADVVLGDWAREVQTRLRDLKTVHERVAFLQNQLALSLRKNESCSGLQKHQRVHQVVAHCVHALKSADGRIAIRELEGITGYSRRYLDLLFREQVGISPKELAGIFRFQRFYRKWAQGVSFDVLRNDLYEYYYDQAHFSKEFKKMTGHSPRKFSFEVSNEFGRRVSLR